jgi:hypothetical protein
MTKSCYELNLDFFPLKKDYPFIDYDFSETIYTGVGKESLSPEFIKWIEEQQLTFDLVLIFNHAPHTGRTIHIDAKFGGTYVRPFSINWNRHPDNIKIKMEWFTSTTNGRHFPGQGTYAYTAFNDDECQLIEEYTHTGPVLFKNSIPHSVSNLGDTVRCGISARFRDKLTWEQIVDKLSAYIK